MCNFKIINTNFFIEKNKYTFAILLVKQPNSFFMNNSIIEEYESQANLMKALSHTTRLFIINELAISPRCVKDLTKMVDVDISTISKHLNILKNAGIICGHKQGNKIYYELKMKCVLDFFKCANKIIRIK